MVQIAHSSVCAEGNRGHCPDPCNVSLGLFHKWEPDIISNCISVAWHPAQVMSLCSVINSVYWTLVLLKHTELLISSWVVKYIKTKYFYRGQPLWVFLRPITMPVFEDFHWLTPKCRAHIFNQYWKSVYEHFLCMPIILCVMLLNRNMSWWKQHGGIRLSCLLHFLFIIYLKICTDKATVKHKSI